MKPKSKRVELRSVGTILLERSRRAKRISLSIRPFKGVRVAVPVGVSFDRDMESWKKAIEDDGLVWTQVSDLQYWNSAAGKLYSVKSIPHNLLLDPEGIIIAKNLRGEALQEKLAEIFN